MAPERIKVPYETNIVDWATQGGPFDPIGAIKAQLGVDKTLYTDFDRLKRNLPWYVKLGNSDEELKWMLQQERDDYVIKGLNDLRGTDIPLAGGGTMPLGSFVDKYLQKQIGLGSEYSSPEEYIKQNPDLNAVRNAATRAALEYQTPSERATTAATTARTQLARDEVDTRRLEALINYAGGEADRGMRKTEFEAGRTDKKAESNLTLDIETMKAGANAKANEVNAQNRIDYMDAVNRGRKELYQLESADFEKERTRQMIMDGLDMLRGMF
jgi:hypothetical protein